MTFSTQLGEKVLVVDSSPESAQALRDLLLKAGYRVLRADDEAQALFEILANEPQAVLLEFGPGGPGALSKIRSISRAPVLAIIGSLEDSFMFAAVAAGADDFLRQPYSQAELLVRLRARLGCPHRPGPAVPVGELWADWERAEVFRNGKLLRLTVREFQLLRALYQNRKQVLTRSWLLQQVWGHLDVEDDRLIDATVKRLRRKVGNELIETVRGIGFRLSSRAFLPAEWRA